MDEMEYFRSPEMMEPQVTALLVIDIQEKLLPVIDGGARVESNSGRLIAAAGILEVGVFVTEQYPQGLGGTTAAVELQLEKLQCYRFEKKSFSCCGAKGLREKLRQDAVANVVLCGIESHVCVLQSAMDLLAEGYRVFVAVDAVGSRKSLDHETALRRIESHGVTLTTTETVLFEWCKTAANPAFKSIQKLIVGSSSR